MFSLVHLLPFVPGLTFTITCNKCQNFQVPSHVMFLAAELHVQLVQHVTKTIVKPEFGRHHAVMKLIEEVVRK